MNKSIKVIPFDKIENAYMVISCRERPEAANKITTMMSFLYVGENCSAEWEPNYGSITVLYPCKKDDPEAEPHWFYEYYTGQVHWSQLAVNNEHLPEKFLSGDFDGLFSVLKRWAQ